MAGDDLELRVAWEQHLGRSRVAAAWFDEVLRRHREPGRHYHDVRHVRWVVRHVLDLSRRHPVDDLPAVVAAGFFHDAVYDPSRDDNETVSAALAARAVTEIGWDRPRPDRVTALVEATAAHDVGTASPDGRLLLAADLAVLAAAPNRYGDYARAVRREYGHLTDAEWRHGRSAVLQALLERPALYAPDLGLDDWERRARANIAAELASLRSD